MRKTVAALQRMNETLSGDDSGLKTVWDEVCVQIQYDQSFYWDTYNEVVTGLVKAHVDELEVHEVEAIWLQTNEAMDWNIESAEERDHYPVWKPDVVEYVTREHVYSEAGSWSNSRIRNYIDQARFSD